MRAAQLKKQKEGFAPWQIFLFFLSIIIIPWIFYVVFFSRFSFFQQPSAAFVPLAAVPPADNAGDVNFLSANVPVPMVQLRQDSVKGVGFLPVLGKIPTSGSQPLFGIKHQGEDAIFALACRYPKQYFQRFVGSLRKFGYRGDIVLAVSPLDQMKPGVAEYLQETNTVAYAFDVDCAGKDNCQLKPEFLGYPDPRPMRTFANIRYALYEYWIRHYTENSYILILDFRDTFFQGNPFGELQPLSLRSPTYDLRMYAENHAVKTIGKCVYNSMWIAKCFSKEALVDLKDKAVICSGSTYGSYPAVRHYLTTMLSQMDTVQCWKKGIESDQGYQNYLFYNGFFNTHEGNATLFQQGDGLINTIGAMNGFRVPKHMKGPLDTFWKIRDDEGFVLNNDKSRSVCVHQWDRWYKELHKFVDTKTYD